MGKNLISQCYKGVFVLASLSLWVFWSLGVPSIVSADDPAALCVLNVVAEGKVLSIVVNQPQNFDVAVALPISNNVSAPVPCDTIGTLAVAVANQDNTNRNVAMQLFTHEGTLICAKGPYLLAVNGGRGVTFADCQ
jgi:hypothetical protein